MRENDKRINENQKSSTIDSILRGLGAEDLRTLDRMDTSYRP
jgi:hypothetical protein